jgi:hypothetical protein
MPSIGRRPFVESGGRYNPGPATTAPLVATSQPLDDALAPPWALRRSSPVKSGEADPRPSFRSMRLPTVSPADPRSELGPRSLDPDRPFWGAHAELIWDPRSPTDFCNQHDVRAPTGALDPRRDGGLDLLPFLDVPRPLPRGSGDTRRAAQRPNVQPQCWFLPLAWVCPTVMPEHSPHHGALFALRA